MRVRNGWRADREGKAGAAPGEVVDRAALLPRVVLLIDSLGSGGAQRQLVELAVRLHDRGWPVGVCAYHPDAFFAEELGRRGVPLIVREGTSKVNHFLVCRQLLRESRPDVVISFLSRPTSLVEIVRATSRDRFRLVASERSMNVKGDVAVRARLVLHAFADAVVTNSDTQAAFIRRSVPWLAPKVTCIRNCVDADTFAPVAQRHVSGPIRVLTLASFVSGKNPSSMVRGFAMFLEQGGSNAGTLRWYGNRLLTGAVPISASSPWREAARLVESFQIGQNVVLGDPKIDVTAEYSRSDVFCLPSSVEGCPNVICEAMASGLPVLAGAVGDIPALVDDGVHGFLFDPTRPDDIARALLRFCSLDARERAEMGARCRARALDLFAPERFVGAWEDVLRRVGRTAPTVIRKGRPCAG